MLAGRHDLSVAERLRLQSQPAANGCIVWIAATIWNGYGRLRVNGRKTLAHRAAWELANGPIPVGVDVLHDCDNPPCINVDHLFLGDDSANQRDRVAKGRHPWSRLTEDEVGEIRRRAAEGRTQRTLAAVFGVTPPQISMIVSGKRRAA